MQPAAYFLKNGTYPVIMMNKKTPDLMRPPIELAPQPQPTHALNREPKRESFGPGCVNIGGRRVNMPTQNCDGRYVRVMCLSGLARGRRGGEHVLSHLWADDRRHLGLAPTPAPLGCRESVAWAPFGRRSRAAHAPLDTPPVLA